MRVHTCICTTYIVCHTSSNYIEMCMPMDIYTHEGKTNKKLNTRPNFEVKITYTIRPLVQYY